MRKEYGDSPPYEINILWVQSNQDHRVEMTVEIMYNRLKNLQ